MGGKNGLYQVETEDGILLCRGATKIRKNGLKLMAGDRVTIEVSVYDLTKGRITWRAK